MRIKEKFKEKNVLNKELNDVKDELEKNIKEKFDKVGIPVKNIDTVSDQPEFKVSVSKTVDRQQLDKLDQSFENFHYSAVSPSEEYVIEIFYKLDEWKVLFIYSQIYEYMNIKENLNKSNSINSKINNIQSELKSYIINEFRSFGVTVSEVNLSPKHTEFEVIVSDSMIREQLNEIDKSIENFHYSAIIPKDDGKFSILYSLEK